MDGLPVCVGFGVGRPEHVRMARGLTAGPVVGGAIIGRFAEGREEGVAPWSSSNPLRGARPT
jgi:tryptophan synthase alpha subunit